MPSQMTLPKLSEAGEDAVVSQWLIAPGARIAVDDPVISMETEKVVVDVASSVSGRVIRLLVEAGETVRVGQPILEVE
jgi:pyruvate/2-oxoglutarate dehydrogenase complex dihydrolipoamide acyltransferase (E2) component